LVHPAMLWYRSLSWRGRKEESDKRSVEIRRFEWLKEEDRRRRPVRKKKRLEQRPSVARAAMDDDGDGYAVIECDCCECRTRLLLPIDVFLLFLRCFKRRVRRSFLFD
jgi:hypothetical protein